MTKQILVVDDDISAHSLFKTIFTQQGYSVELARNGNEKAGKNF